MLQKKASLRNGADVPVVSPGENSLQVPPSAAELDEEPSITVERGENNDVSISFSSNNREKPTRLIFNGIFEKRLLRTFLMTDLITTIVLKNIRWIESYAFGHGEFPRLKHIVFDGGNCCTQIPKTVSKISYLGSYEIEKNLSLPAHIREVAITAEISRALRSISCGNLRQINIDGQDTVVDGIIRFGPELGGLKAIDLSGSSFHEVHISNLPFLEYLFLSNSTVSSLKIESESMHSLRNIVIIGCEHLRLDNTCAFFSSSPRLVVTYDGKTTEREVFDNNSNSNIAVIL
jgi:hypothetical protein